MQKDCVIIGGGISGLATAYRLKKAGLDALLLEKNNQPGGAIRSEICDDFLIDYGPNSTLETSPKIREFVNEVGLKDRRIYASDSAKNRYILKNGQLLALPMSPPKFLTTKLFSWQAKLRLFAEPFIKPAPADKEETISQFVTRRLGKEFLDYAINPFVAGVYAGDPDRLSVRSAVAKIYALEKNYGSLIKGALKGAKERKQRAETDKTKAQLFSFKNGMQELVDALVKLLGDTVKTNAAVASLEKIPTDNLYEIKLSGDANEIIQTKSIIFTSPAYVTADLIKNLDEALARSLNKITYPPVTMAFLGYKKLEQCRDLDGFGFLVPKVENRKILGNIWSSTLFLNRAPAGGAALTTFVGGMRQPELTEQSDADLAGMVQSELRDILSLQGTPDIVKIKRWQRAIPQYELGHQAILEEVENFEKRYQGLFISGNFSGGISVGDCIVNSEKVAGLVVGELKQKMASMPVIDSKSFELK